ncbi:MAG: DAHL domain-containing protein [Candidatus Berkiellales bacterium]
MEEKSRVALTRITIGVIFVIIVAIYYTTELRPFKYAGYEESINKLQRFDAELNEAIVLSRVGSLKYYNPIDSALDNIDSELNYFKTTMENHPDPEINERLKKLEAAIKNKEKLTGDFKRINPILINAINQFSFLSAQLIEAQANAQLVENALKQDLHQQLEQEFQFQMLDKIRDLFRGILVYINLRTEERRAELLNLVQEIRRAPQIEQLFPKIKYILDYADKILELQPQLGVVDKELFEVPIVDRLNALNESYNAAFRHYLAGAYAYRIILYILVFALLVILRWAFSRLRGTVTALNIEVGQRVKAQHELANINRQLEQRVAQRTKELTIKNQDLNQALGDLKDAQDQLIMQEKMASVGMLTTGIAHEIKNPLNFINNFSDISVELAGELKEELEASKEKLGAETLSSIEDIINDLKINCSKIKEHGVRADNIVKTMLLHSQEAGLQKEMVDIEKLMDDNIQIALENFRATTGKLDIKLEKDFDPNLEKIIAAPQTLARVFMYLIDNALYALKERQLRNEANYEPTLKITINKQDQNAVIKVRDNGTGIPKNIMDKIYEPFFTTKPTGKGNTGLGLSICYDTVVKQHKGDLRVVSEEGVFTEFTVMLPIKAKSSET